MRKWNSSSHIFWLSYKLCLPLLPVHHKFLFHSSSILLDPRESTGKKERKMETWNSCHYLHPFFPSINEFLFHFPFLLVLQDQKEEGKKGRENRKMKKEFVLHISGVSYNPSLPSHNAFLFHAPSLLLIHDPIKKTREERREKREQGKGIHVISSSPSSILFSFFSFHSNSRY